MADFQQVNVAGIEPLGNPAMRDLIDTLRKGYEAFQTPKNTQLAQQKAQEDITAQALKNALEKQYGTQDKESQIALRNAQAQKSAQDAQYGPLPSTSPAAEALALKFLKDKYGSDSEVYKNALKYQSSRDESKSILNNQRNTYANATSWKSLPASEKNRVIANAVGMGYDPAEAAALLSQGKSLEDLAQAKGQRLSEVEPNYPLSAQTISQTKNREAFSNEISYLDENINGALKGVGHKVLGYSPTQIWSAIKNDNPDEQGKILAGRALAPEMAALRLKAAGGNVGIEAIRELQHAALANMEIFESTISPEARQAMNKYISQWISGAVDKYNKSINQSAQLGKKESKPEQNNNYIEYDATGRRVK